MRRELQPHILSFLRRLNSEFRRFFELLGRSTEELNIATAEHVFVAGHFKNGSLDRDRKKGTPD